MGQGKKRLALSLPTASASPAYVNGQRVTFHAAAKTDGLALRLRKILNGIQ
jgi:hypothetical protein